MVLKRFPYKEEITGSTPVASTKHLHQSILLAMLVKIEVMEEKVKDINYIKRW